MADPAPDWAFALLEWLRAHLDVTGPRTVPPSQGTLWSAPPYNEEAPAIHSVLELKAAVEHLEYALFRRYQNQLTRAERARLDNSIRNALYKVERFASGDHGPENEQIATLSRGVRDLAQRHRDDEERRRSLARRADRKLAQLDNLTPDDFEEFVAEVFEALGYEVTRVGGSGDEGADLLLARAGQRAVVQCKYHKGRAVVGSPEVQRFLGTVHHTRSHKGYFVTTRTFTLSAEKFARENPLELIDGPRLVELVHEAMGHVPAGDDHPPLLPD